MKGYSGALVKGSTTSQRGSLAVCGRLGTFQAIGDFPHGLVPVFSGTHVEFLRHKCKKQSRGVNQKGVTKAG